MPASLEGALEALHADQDFLLAGGVFSEDLIANWIAMKDPEVRSSVSGPTPTNSASTTTSEA